MAPRQSFWEKLGGGSLTVAVLFHVILLIIGGFWVFQIIREPEKEVDFMPPSGSGGERGAEHQIQQKKQAQIAPATQVKRVFAESATASCAIPEQSDYFGEMSALSALGGAASGGLGGPGSGGGKGDGKGLGVGSGFAAGMSDGKGMKNPSGMIEPNGNGLAGTLYDAKQPPVTRPTTSPLRKWASCCAISPAMVGMSARFPTNTSKPSRSSI